MCIAGRGKIKRKKQKLAENTTKPENKKISKKNQNICRGFSKDCGKIKTPFPGLFYSLQVELPELVFLAHVPPFGLAVFTVHLHRPDGKFVLAPVDVFMQ